MTMTMPNGHTVWSVLVIVAVAIIMLGSVMPAMADHKDPKCPNGWDITSTSSEDPIDKNENLIICVKIINGKIMFRDDIIGHFDKP